MNVADIMSIRILPNDKETFSKESDFRYFVEHTMTARGGYYYFPSMMMRCPVNTLILFQYAGMIRAVGLMIDFGKTPTTDEQGVKYAGYYKFDTETLRYLDVPISKHMMQVIYPAFMGFSQCKQFIPLECLDSILSWK